MKILGDRKFHWGMAGVIYFFVSLRYAYPYLTSFEYSHPEPFNFILITFVLLLALLLGFGLSLFFTRVFIRRLKSIGQFWLFVAFVCLALDQVSFGIVKGLDNAFYMSHAGSISRVHKYCFHERFERLSCSQAVNKCDPVCMSYYDYNEIQAVLFRLSNTR